MKEKSIENRESLLKKYMCIYLFLFMITLAIILIMNVIYIGSNFSIIILSIKIGLIIISIYSYFKVGNKTVNNFNYRLKKIYYIPIFILIIISSFNIIEFIIILTEDSSIELNLEILVNLYLFIGSYLFMIIGFFFFISYLENYFQDEYFKYRLLNREQQSKYVLDVGGIQKIQSKFYQKKIDSEIEKLMEGYEKWEDGDNLSD